MKEACKNELEKADTMQDVFDSVIRHYNLKETELNFTTRIMVIAGIKTAIKVTKAKEK